MMSGAKLTAAAILAAASAITCPAAADQAPAPDVGAPQIAIVEIPSGDAVLHGRFFAARADRPVATVLIVPGWGGHPEDASGMGAALSARGANVLFVNFRGVQKSTGSFGYAAAIADIGSALAWLRGSEASRRHRVDPGRIVLAGNSFGGGVAMVYAVGDPSVKLVVSIVGADHGVLARRIRNEAGYASRVQETFARSRAPGGTVRFDPDALVRELIAREGDNDLVALAPKLANRNVLLIGAWADETAPIERDILPLYRALVRQKGSDVTIIAYPDGHGLASERDRVADDVMAWLATRMQR